MVDFVIAAKEEKLIDQVANKLQKHFQLKDLGELKFYLGIEVKKTEDGFFSINQTTKIERYFLPFKIISWSPIKSIGYRSVSINLFNVL